MKTEYHAFVDGDAGPCGAIMRHVESDGLTTRTVFKMGDAAPVYLVDHAVRYDGDSRTWTRFDYHSPTSDSRHSGVRHPDGTVDVDGTPAPQLIGAVGGYTEHLVLTEMLLNGADTVSYAQFDEAQPEEGTESAELRRGGTEVTGLLDGSTVSAERVQLTLDGRPANAHWCIDGVVVKSDWCGAQSFLVDDLDDLCSGLHPEVEARIREFAAHAARPAAE